MISIALTSYNGEKYIREQLDSISNQTIQDFEIIVCDDVSKDNTWNILQEYKEKDNRFRIYRNEQNLGFKMHKVQLATVMFYIKDNLLFGRGYDFFYGRFEMERLHHKRCR